MIRIFENGKIFTSNSEQLYVESMVVEDGRITWTGTGEEMPELKADERIDLAGRTVIPGFVDAHMHPMMLAEYSRQIACLPPTVNSIESGPSFHLFELPIKHFQRTGELEENAS